MTQSAELPESAPVATAAARPTWVRWRILVLVMAFSFVNHFNRTSMPIAGDEHIMPEHSIRPTQMGWVYSAFLIVYTLGMIPGGWIIDRYGPRAALAGLGIGTGLFCALTGAVGLMNLSNYALWIALLVVRGLMGLCAAPLHPSGGKVVSHWFPEGGRAWANGLVVGIACVGMATVFKLFGSLIDFVGWPHAFMVTGAITAALGLFWAFYATDGPAQHAGVNFAERALIAGSDHSKPKGHARASLWSELRVVVRNRSLVLLTLSYTAVGYFEYLFIYWMHYYFEDQLRLGKEMSRWYAGIPLLAMAAGMPLGGWLVDRLEPILGPRWGRTIVPASGMFLGAVCLLAGLARHDAIWIVSWFAIAHAALGASEAPFWTTAIELGGRRGATSGALCNTGGNGAGLIAPILTPWVGEHFGWTAAISLGSVFCLLGMGLWGWIDPRERVKETTGSESEGLD
jgi:MFS family permease